MASTASPFVHQQVPSGPAGGSAFVPDEDKHLTGPRAPSMPSASPYYLKHHESRWQLMGGKVLPILGRLTMRAGVAGVTTGATRGSVSMRAARAATEERGWTLIPFDSIPDHHAVPGQPKSYMRRLANRPDVALTIYEIAYPGTAETVSDQARYVEFLEHQITSGVVAPAPTYVIERMIRKCSDKLERASDLAASVPSKKIEARRLAADLKTLESILASRIGHLVPAEGAPFAPDEE